MKKTLTKTEQPLINPAAVEAFETLCDLALAVTEYDRELATLSQEVDEARLEAIEARRERIAELQGALLAATSDAERLCRLNRPAWFGEKKSLKLVDATLAFRASKSLVVPSEAATIAILKSGACPLASANYVRTREELDLEALEKLDDRDLALIGIARKETESFSLKPVKTDLSKTAAAEPGGQDNETIGQSDNRKAVAA